MTLLQVRWSRLIGGAVMLGAVAALPEPAFASIDECYYFCAGRCNYICSQEGQSCIDSQILWGGTTAPACHCGFVCSGGYVGS